MEDTGALRHVGRPGSGNHNLPDSGSGDRRQTAPPCCQGCGPQRVGHRRAALLQEGPLCSLGMTAPAQEGKRDDTGPLVSLENEGDPNPTAKSGPLLPACPQNALLSIVIFSPLVVKCKLFPQLKCCWRNHHPINGETHPKGKQLPQPTPETRAGLVLCLAVGVSGTCGGSALVPPCPQGWTVGCSLLLPHTRTVVSLLRSSTPATGCRLEVSAPLFDPPPVLGFPWHRGTGRFLPLCFPAP